MDFDELFECLRPEQEVQTEVEDEEYCDRCKANTVINNNGEFICHQCGNVKCTMLDTTAEWRYYGNDDSKSSDPTRCGMPTNALLPESSYGSTIGFRSKESFEMKKIRNYHGWNAMPYKERSLYNVFDTISVKAANHGITPCIIEEAKIFYKKIAESKISRGANRKGLIASCIYKACKLKNVPRSHKEIADMFDVNITHMTKGCKKFDEIMNLKKDNTKSSNINGSCSTDYIQRFCSKLNIGPNILDICKHVCQKAEEFGMVSENTPPSIASGSIFLVCNLLDVAISKKDISAICGISEVTISKCYKKLLSYHQHLLPKHILDKLYQTE
jgi:transcription initiation factor TFIIB